MVYVLLVVVVVVLLLLLLLLLLLRLLLLLLPLLLLRLRLLVLLPHQVLLASGSFLPEPRPRHHFVSGWARCSSSVFLVFKYKIRGAPFGGAHTDRRLQSRQLFQQWELVNSIRFASACFGPVVSSWVAVAVAFASSTAAASAIAALTSWTAPQTPVGLVVVAQEVDFAPIASDSVEVAFALDAVAAPSKFAVALVLAVAAPSVAVALVQAVTAPSVAVALVLAVKSPLVIAALGIVPTVLLVVVVVVVVFGLPVAVAAAAAAPTMDPEQACQPAS